MKKINNLIIKYGLNKNSRNEIKTTCDLYGHLLSGYFVILVMIGFLAVYLMGMYNFIVLDKELGAMLFYRSYEGEPKTSQEFYMAFASVTHALALIVGFFYLLINCLFYLIQGLLYLSTTPRVTSFFSKLKMPSLWCRKLTPEEIKEIQKL